MSAKVFLVLCASALLVRTISAQCINYGNGIGLANNLARAEITGASLGGGCGCGGYGVYGLAAPVAVGSGGGLAVSTSSAYVPNGISVVSDNAIDGVVDVAGQLPLLAAVGFEGQLPTAGAAGVVYSCGNGNVGISGESLAASGIGASRLAGPRLAGAGLAGNGLYETGLAGAGLAGSLLGRPCGCGTLN